MDLRVPPLKLNIALESNPLKSRVSVRRLAVQQLLPGRSAPPDTVYIYIYICIYIYVYIVYTISNKHISLSLPLSLYIYIYIYIHIHIHIHTHEDPSRQQTGRWAGNPPNRWICQTSLFIAIHACVDSNANNNNNNTNNNDNNNSTNTCIKWSISL